MFIIIGQPSGWGTDFIQRQAGRPPVVPVAPALSLDRVCIAGSAVKTTDMGPTRTVMILL